MREILTTLRPADSWAIFVGEKTPEPVFVEGVVQILGKKGLLLCGADPRREVLSWLSRRTVGTILKVEPSTNQRPNVRTIDATFRCDPEKFSRTS